MARLKAAVPEPDLTANNPLIGTWRLVSWENRRPDGHVSYPFGRNAVGYILYSPDGYVFVPLMPPDRARFAVNDRFQGTLAEDAQAARSYLSYCGRYEFKGDRVVHHVELSLFPNWVGGDQERFVTLTGDRLALSTPPLLFEGTQQTAHLIWERV